jgi:signal transduction histidine kinase
MALVMPLLLLSLYFSMQHILQDYVLTRLQHDAESLISVIQQGKDQQWKINPNQMSTVYSRVKSGHYFRASVNNQVITSRSLFDASFPLAPNLTSLYGQYIKEGPGQETWLIWYQQVYKNDEVLKVWIAEDIKPLEIQLLQYTSYAFLLVLMVTFFLIYLQHRTLKKSFKIFDILRKNLASIRYKETEKFGIHVPNEIMPLVNEIELLVDQLRNRIERTRHAIGNLAHELKRPIQLLSLPQQTDNIDMPLKPLEEIKNIIERELKRAKISGSRSVGGSFNLSEEIPFMIEIMSKIYPRIEITCVNSEHTGSLILDRDDMLELTGNLLDNACKFASRKVQMNFSITHEMLKLYFEDDGPGLDNEQIEHIKKRGFRLDESIQGHGLGLSICIDILDSYQGNLLFLRSSLGGLKVIVELPLHEINSAP